jgi:hypothetical protein
MTGALKPELDPLSGPERLTLFCVASRMDTPIAGFPDGIAELLVMKNLARRDQARLSLTDQGRATLHTLLGLGSGEKQDGSNACVRTPMPTSLTLASLIRRHLMALVRSRPRVALGRLDEAVAVSRRHPVRATACEPPKKKPRRSGAKSATQDTRSRGRGPAEVWAVD